MPDPLDMAGQDRTGTLDVTCAQGCEDGPVIVIGPFLPVRLPGREEKSGTCSVKVVDRGQQAGHPAWFDDQAMEALVRILP